MRFSPRSRVAVVGAGIGGLAAAISLGAAGLDVDLYEALPIVGGKAGAACHDGVEFDTGPSLLTLPEVFDEVFRRGGTTIAHELALVAGQQFRYHFPDGTTIDVDDDHERTTANIRRARGAQAAAEFSQFMRYATRIWNAAAPHFVYGPAPSVSSVIDLGASAIAELIRIDPLRTMKQAIDAQVSDPHVRDILYRYATYNGSDVRQAPATLNCIAAVELAGGGFGVRGGIYELVRALERVAEGVNVSIYRNTPVQQIHCVDGKAVGVVVGDEIRHHDVVIVNADYSHLREYLLEGSVASRLREPPPPSMSGHTFVYRTRRRDDRPAHEVLFPENYEREFSAIFDDDRVSEQPTIYVCSMEQAHRRRGWQEDEALFVMVNAPCCPVGAGSDEKRPACGGSDGRGLSADLRESIAERLRSHDMLSPDASLVWQRSSGDLSVQFPGTGGAIYGGSSNGALAAFRRPANRSVAIDGLFICGGSVHPGGGLPLCALSGLRAADEAQSYLGLAGRLRSIADHFVRLEVTS